jgi:hypothetical protein
MSIPVRIRAVILAVPFVAAIAASATGQVTRSDPAQRPDSATVARLQEELNWRNKIRVLTPYATFELREPSVSSEGIAYTHLDWLQAPPDSVPFEGVLPLSDVLAVEVRQGHHGTGIVIGASAFFVLGSAFYGGLCEFDCDVGSGLTVGLISAVPGVVFGWILGEALYTWEPVYTVDSAGRVS